MVKLVRFLRVMLVAFGMSVFISCNILFDCLLVVGVKAFSFLSVKKMRKYLFLPHINAYICMVNK